MRLSRGIFLFCSFSLLALTACAGVTDAEENATNDNGEVASTSSELRALLESEKLGSIAYGETRTANYTENPLYRGYSFSGRAGDSVDIWVRGSGTTDALGFLLASDYTTLASNDNASSGTRDSHITFQLPTTSTYWIAFRESNQESATFTVSLNGDTGSPGGDVWDSTLCTTGEPFTKTVALRYFAPASNTSRDLANVRVYRRKRNCNTVTGCAAWEDNPKDVIWSSDNQPVRGGNFYATTGSDSSVHLWFKADNDTGRIALSCHGLSTTNSITCDVPPSGSSSGYLYDRTAALFYTVSLKKSTSCFRFAASGTTSPSSTSDYVESQWVAYGSVLAP